MVFYVADRVGFNVSRPSFGDALKLMLARTRKRRPFARHHRSEIHIQVRAIHVLAAAGFTHQELATLLRLDERTIYRRLEAIRRIRERGEVD